MRDQLNAGAISETTQTWKAIHTIHTPIHANKVNMKGWWGPNDIRGPYGPKASWDLSYRWGKTPKKSHANLSRPVIEPGSAAWQTRMLPPAPQWWTKTNIGLFNKNIKQSLVAAAVRKGFIIDFNKSVHYACSFECACAFECKISNTIHTDIIKLAEAAKCLVFLLLYFPHSQT